jgi:hypothetical protein
VYTWVLAVSFLLVLNSQSFFLRLAVELRSLASFVGSLNHTSAPCPLFHASRQGIIHACSFCCFPSFSYYSLSTTSKPLPFLCSPFLIWLNSSHLFHFSLQFSTLLFAIPQISALWSVSPTDVDLSVSSIPVLKENSLFYGIRWLLQFFYNFSDASELRAFYFEYCPFLYTLVLSSSGFWLGIISTKDLDIFNLQYYRHS